MQPVLYNHVFSICHFDAVFELNGRLCSWEITQKLSSRSIYDIYVQWYTTGSRFVSSMMRNQRELLLTVLKDRHITMIKMDIEEADMWIMKNFTFYKFYTGVAGMHGDVIRIARFRRLVCWVTGENSGLYPIVFPDGCRKEVVQIKVNL